MLNNPKPWNECTEHRKRLYQKMFVWFKTKDDGMKSLKAMDDLEGTSNEKADNDNLPDLPEIPLDSAQVGQKILKIVRSRNIPLSLFGLKVLQTKEKSWPDRLLKTPKPWDKLSAYKKRLFVKLDNWCNCEEAIGYLQALSESQNKKRNSSQFTKLPNVPSDLELKTEKVAGTSYGALAKQVVSMHTSDFGKLLRNPWSKCTEYQKKLWIKMDQWSQSADEMRSVKP
jgi:hypothetical protein